MGIWKSVRCSNQEAGLWVSSMSVQVTVGPALSWFDPHLGPGELFFQSFQELEGACSHLEESSKIVHIAP